ncbi:MAG: hypothetical protein ABIR70_08795 [Bryobacteraceae bacterium]
MSQSSDSFSAFYLEARQALRIAVAELRAKDFLQGQDSLSTRLRELLVPKAAQFGIEIERLELDEVAQIGWFKPV